MLVVLCVCALIQPTFKSRVQSCQVQPRGPTLVEISYTFGVKSLEIFAEIRKSYSKSQSEILKLANFPYFNSVNFLLRVRGGGVSLWAWSNRHGHAQILSASARAVEHRSCRL